MYITNNSAVGLITKISDMLNKNSLGLLKQVLMFYHLKTRRCMNTIHL